MVRSRSGSGSLLSRQHAYCEISVSGPLPTFVDGAANGRKERPFHKKGISDIKAKQSPIYVVSIGLQMAEGSSGMRDLFWHTIAGRFALVAVLLAAATVSEAGSLVTAIQQDDLSQVEQEISNGADVTEEDMFLGAPIVLAAIRGNAKIVELLLEHGALVQIEDHVIGTPLHAAAFNGHLDVVKILIEHGSNIEAERASNGETPLHAAAEGGNREVVRLLISLGGNVNARSKDKYGPIHSAAASEHFDVVELLLANGAAPRPVDPVAPLLDSADPVEGARLFRGSCASCHSTAKGGPNQSGPNLWDIVKRQRASVSDFEYSSALLRRGGTWTYESLNSFLARPTDFIPGTKMTFSAATPTVEDRHKRAHLIAYLRQLSDEPATLPTP